MHERSCNEQHEQELDDAVVEEVDTPELGEGVADDEYADEELAAISGRMSRKRGCEKRGETHDDKGENGTQGSEHRS